MYIIVGLGNPERKYAGTRHNIGFSAITAISDAYGISMDIKKHKAVCGKGMIAGNKVLLAMPQTYMNLSGESVRELVDFYKIDPEEELIIIYDDIALAPGKLRVRAKGSAGGHNGLKSIINHTGTDGFTRIKVGVGANQGDLVKHVLGKFPKEERVLVDDAIRNAASAAEVIVMYDENMAMNKFN